MTYAEIADRYGVTETAVYLRLKADGLIGKPHADHGDLIPWTVKTEHQHAHPANMLRTLSRRRLGLPNTETRERMLDKWLEDLKANNLVVCYDPTMPPTEGQPKGGWFYMPRKRSDGDSIIRVTKPGQHKPRKPLA